MIYLADARLKERNLRSFWNRVDKRPTGCWEWTGCINSNGYGHIRVSNRLWATHRLSYLMRHGSLEEDQLICHACDNPRCVNPAHLWAGNHLDNSRDMTLKKRYAAWPGTSHRNARFEEGEVQLMRHLAACKVPERLIGQCFRTKAGTVNLIAKRLSWRHVPDCDWPVTKIYSKAARNRRLTKKIHPGETNGRAVLTDDEVISIRTRYYDGESGPSIAKDYPVGLAVVYHIIKGRSWKHVGGPTTQGENRRNRQNRSAQTPTGGPCKLTIDQAAHIKYRLQTETPTQIAKDYPGVSRSAIYSIHYGRTWRHIAPSAS